MRYYSTRRPLAPGGYPKRKTVKEIKNFDSRIFLEEIGMEVWGYIEYTEPLEENEAEAYELIPGDRKTFWSVTTSFDDKGRVVSNITNKVQSVIKPESTCTSTSRRDVYIDWFDSYEAAYEWMEEARKI